MYTCWYIQSINLYLLCWVNILLQVCTVKFWTALFCNMNISWNLPVFIWWQYCRKLTYSSINRNRSIHILDSLSLEIDKVLNCFSLVEWLSQWFITQPAVLHVLTDIHISLTYIVALFTKIGPGHLHLYT